jgi:hypothetical protein
MYKTVFKAYFHHLTSFDDLNGFTGVWGYDINALKSSLEKKENQIELLVAAKDNLEGMIIMENLLIKKLIDFIFRIKYGILEHT